jgi:hypothetical protein
MRKQWALIVLAAILMGDTLPSSIAAQKRGRSAAAASPKARAPELGSVKQFKEAFQNDIGKVRLVALISPT